jgi:hypothetical protein
MFLLIGNSGSNHNYIGLKLSNSKPENSLTYHNFGTHGGTNAIDISHINSNKIEEIIKNSKPIFMVCFASKYKEDLFTVLKKNKVTTIQILIEKHQECLLINWQEKLRVNPENNNDLILSKEWEEQQKNIWKNYTKFPIERAVLEWTYKLYDKEFVDVRKTNHTDSYFLFGSLYESYDHASLEFKKFNIEYSKKEYDDWKRSQKIVFDSWKAIRDNTDTPKKLKFDYQRGMAIALKGIREGIDLQNCWSRYESLLN